MTLNRKKVTLLSRSEMQKLVGGETPYGSGSGNDCNYFCSTDSDCKHECLYCEEVSNWRPYKVCFKGKTGSH